MVTTNVLGAGASAAVLAAHRRMIGGSRARSRALKLRGGNRVHLLEAGDGPPVLHLHGTNTSALSHLPLLDRMPDVRSFAVDRPGMGLSDPVRVARGRFRDAAVAFVEEVLDVLELGAATLVGGSMGGTWAVWYALARPERVRNVVLLGAAPLLPATRAPLPLRLAATPVVGDLLPRLFRPTRANLVRLMASVGEQATIVRYPDLLDSLVAAAADPRCAAVNRAELRAMITPRGFRPAMRIQPDELRTLHTPVLLVWGNRDPVASVAAAQAVLGMLPTSRLEVLPAGHVPWLGHPDRVAELVATAAHAR